MHASVRDFVAAIHYPSAMKRGDLPAPAKDRTMPFSRLRTLLLVFLLAFFVALVQFDIIAVAFEKLNLSRESGYLLFMSALIGSMINLPLFRMRRRQTPRGVAEDATGAPFGMREAPGAPQVTVAVNVGGCLIPASFSFYLFAHGAMGAAQTWMAVATVALVSYWSSRPMRGIGVVMPFLVAPVTAVLVASLLDHEQRAPLAYIGGTLGVLLGADLFRLRDIRGLGAPVASIGGAGTFDGVFITGLLAVLLA
jgi:uncharacterized membrane protein